MADLDSEEKDDYSDIDIDALWSKVQRRPLLLSKRKSVLLAPEFVQRLKGEQVVDEGGDLALTFKVNGVPKPTLRWFKDDEEVKDHPRLRVEEEEGEGGYRLNLFRVNKGDEAAYRCRAENGEGSASCCFFLTVKGKPKSPKRDSKGGHKRTVSFPTMFSTIVEKVEEEEKAGLEASIAPASPLTHLYDFLTLKERNTCPAFLGEWAFVNGTFKARGGSTGSYPSSGSESELRNTDDSGLRDFADSESGESDDVFLDSPEAARAAAPSVPQAPDVVFFLQTPQQPAQRGRAVPPDVDRPPAEVASRGETGSAPLTSREPRDQNDSREGVPSSRLVGKKGVTSSGTKAEGKKSAPPSAGAQKREAASSAGKVRAVANTANKDKATSAASSAGVVVVVGQNGSLPLPGSAASSPVTSIASKLNAAKTPVSSLKAAASVAQTNPVPDSRTSGPSSLVSRSLGSSSTSRNVGYGTPSCVEPSTKSVNASADSADLSRSFSLSTTDGKERTGRPVVRGPFGALLSSGGDAGKKSFPPTTRISSSKKGKTSSTSPSVTLTPPGQSAAPALREKASDSHRLVVRQDSNPDRMCDHCKSIRPDCQCGLGLSTLPVTRARQASEENSPLGSSATASLSLSLPSSASSISSRSPSPSSPSTVSSSTAPSSPTNSPSPSSHCQKDHGLLQPEFKREEREPTPIPPDTHVPTGKSLAVQYKCSQHLHAGHPQQTYSTPVMHIKETGSAKSKACPQLQPFGDSSDWTVSSEAEQEEVCLESPNWDVSSKRQPGGGKPAPLKLEVMLEESEPQLANPVPVVEKLTLEETKYKPRKEEPRQEVILDAGKNPSQPKSVPKEPKPDPAKSRPPPKPKLDESNSNLLEEEPRQEPNAVGAVKKIPESAPAESGMVWKEFPPTVIESSLSPRQLGTDPNMVLQTSYSAQIKVRLGRKENGPEDSQDAQLKIDALKPEPAREPHTERTQTKPEAEAGQPAAGTKPRLNQKTRESPLPQESPGPREDPGASPRATQPQRPPTPLSFSIDGAGGQPETIYIDPVHHELIHVKSLHPSAPSPPRTRSAGENAQQPGPSRRSPGQKQDRGGKRKVSDPRPKSDSGIYASISTDPERHLVWQYLRELVFLICLLTFLGLVFNVQPHVFVLAVMAVHVGLFLSRKYIFVKK